MKENNSPENGDSFKVEALGIIFDPEKRKILIGREENNPYLKKTIWRFPGGRVHLGNKVEDRLKSSIKERTGYNAEVLGSVFARVPPEKNDLLLIYYLCEITSGKLKAGGSFSELKWVDIEKIKDYFVTKFEPELQECINHLK